MEILVFENSISSSSSLDFGVLMIYKACFKKNQNPTSV